MELRFALAAYQSARADFTYANTLGNRAVQRIAAAYLNRARARLQRAMRAASESIGRAYVAPRKSH